MQLKEAIKKIVDLQEIDKKIYKLVLRKNTEIPEKIKELKALIKQKEESFTSLKEKVKRIEMAKKNKEGDLAQKEENLKKAKAQLYQLKSNKEYQIKIKEIASLEADISCAEEAVIESLDMIDQEKSKINKEKESVDKETASLKQNIEKMQEDLKEDEKKISDFKNKRKHYTEGIGKKILEQYESLLQKRGGLAIVPVKNNNCGACHISLTHQKVNEIKMYDKLVFCESCIRILYIPEDLELKESN